MTNKEAIDRIRQNIGAALFHAALSHDEEVLQDTKLDVEAFKMAIKALEQGTFKYLKKPNNNLQGWIPCSERLPEEEGWYLVTIQNDKTEKRRTENDLFAIGIAEAHKHTPYKFCKDGYRQTVIAWMPLPEPYEAS